VCNKNKSDELDPNLPILNPFSDTPNDFLFATGPYIFSKPGQARGKLTEKLLDLNRVDLIEQRLERIESIRKLLDIYENEKHSTLKKIIYKEIIQELDVDKEYSFVINSMVNIVGVAAT